MEIRKAIVISALGVLTALLVSCGTGGDGASQDSPQGSVGGVGSPPGKSAQAVPAAQADDAAVNYVGKMSLTPDNGTIGTVVTARGSGFDANASLDLVWQTVAGSWNVDYDKYLGRDYKDISQPLTNVRTDATGTFEAKFTVPEGFGFYHDVRLLQDRVIRNKAAFYVQMEVQISPTSGPVGTPITIEARGIGYLPLQSNWDIIYDNRFTGFMSAVSTNGYAKFTIPATGPVGKHIISILHGSFTFPYMNMQQSPEPDRPTWAFEFTITKGNPVLPPPVTSQSFERERPSALGVRSGAALTTDWLSGTVGSPVNLRGTGFSPNESVELQWFRVVGNRVGGTGWDEAATVIGKVTAGSDGSFSLPFATLDDLGGDHRIEAVVRGSKSAETKYYVTPSAEPLSPSSGPAGTRMTIHLKGGGWTETANIYTVVYDNAYIGYSCAFNSQGDITVYLPAVGEPGWHFIDLYPAIYKGKEMKGIETFRIPQLTFGADHPGEKLPAFRFAFLVTEG